MAKSLLTVKIKKRKAILPRGADSRHMGSEPTWDDIAFLNESDIRLREMTAYNWYNYFYEPKEGRKFIVEFMEDAGMSRASIAMFGRLPDSQISSSVAAMARMYTMGLADDERKTKIETKIIDMCRKAADLARASAKAAASAPVKADSSKILIAEVEGYIDDNSDNLYNFYEWLKKKEAKPSEVKSLIDYYVPWLQELIEANERNVDPDLKEAYSYMSKKELKARMTMFSNLVGDCESYLSNNRKTTVRKPRKTKPKSADKIVSRIKFQKEHTELKLVSIDPSKIVGSSELWLFNTKTNVLAHYVAAEATGLTVKGTTIQSFSDKSEQKKLRKPADALANITGATAKAAERAFNALTTKASNPNGRINEQTIILRAVK